MNVVLLGGLDDYLIKVAQDLVRRGVPVTHFLDRYQRPASRQGILAQVESIDARQFIYPKQILELNKGQEPILSGQLLESFGKAERVWLAVSDRYTQTLSVLARKQLFRELLEYFYRWVQQEKVRVIIFPNVPHAGWNNILYFVAKHFDIATLVLEPTRLNDRVMLWDDYESVSKVPADFLAGAGRDVVQQHVEANILREISVDSSWMVVSDDINKASLQKSQAPREVLVLARALVTGLVDKQRPVDLSLDQPWSWWTAHWCRYVLQRRTRHLRVLYERLATTTIPQKPYILFFLNYQPEKTTTPMGGMFDDQLLAVRLLAAALPNGWRLLVKEHPRQFGAHVDAAPFRSAAFYEELARFPGVQLVSPQTLTAQLLAGCAATATVTGSIGWQGLLQGKPTLNFGRSWYAACRSCYVVSSVADMKAALEEIQQKNVAAVELDVLKLLAFERSQFILGGNSDKYVTLSKRSPDQLAESLAEAIVHRIDRSIKVYEKEYAA